MERNPGEVGEFQAIWLRINSPLVGSPEAIRADNNYWQRRDWDGIDVCTQHYVSRSPIISRSPACVGRRGHWKSLNPRCVGGDVHDLREFPETRFTGGERQQQIYLTQLDKVLQLADRMCVGENEARKMVEVCCMKNSSL